MTNARVDIEVILQESRWLRALAGHLAADAAEADDVAQQTYLAALASPPPDDRPVRPWLTRVARNVIRSRHRADQRRQRREQAAAQPTSAVGPDQLLEQVELQRLLTELVAELSEPYRSVIVLRFYRGRSAAEIAAAERVPAATVRWRIQRGLALLRLELDRRHGGRRDGWRLALVSFAELPMSAAAPGAAGAGALASMMAKIGLAAAVALTVAALAALLVDLGSGPQASAGERARDREGAVAAAALPARGQPAGRAVGARPIDRARGARPGAASPGAIDVGRGERSAAGGVSPDAESLVRTERLPLSSEEVGGRLGELAPLYNECDDAAVERDPAFGGGGIFEITIVVDPDVGPLVESAEFLPRLGGSAADEQFVECMRETTFAVDLTSRTPLPSWLSGRKVFHFPILVGRSPDELIAVAEGTTPAALQSLFAELRDMRRTAQEAPSVTDSIE